MPLHFSYFLIKAKGSSLTPVFPVAGTATSIHIHGHGKRIPHTANKVEMKSGKKIDCWSGAGYGQMYRPALLTGDGSFISPYPCIFPKLFFPNHLDLSLILLLVPSLNVHSKSSNTLTAVQFPNALPLHSAIRLLPRGSTTHLSPKGAGESSSFDSPCTLGLTAPMGTDCPFLSLGSPSCLCASLPLC